MSRATWVVLVAVAAGLPLVVLADRLTLAGLWPALPPLGPTSPASPRLAQPLGYWNALGLWCVVGCVVLLMSAAHAGHHAARRTAGATIPLILATGYLTYSRGAILTAILGLLVALCLAPRRRAAILQLVALTVPSAVAVGAVALDTGVAFGTSPARWWCVAILALAAGFGAALADRAAGAAAFWRAEVIEERMTGFVDRHIGRRVAVALVGAVVVAGAGMGVRSVVDGFGAPYQPVSDVRARFGDVSSGGRTALWEAAWKAWRAHPSGLGADSFGVTFDRVAPLQFTARDAHSLYLERLMERGTAGLLVLLATMAAALAALLVSRRAAADAPVRGGLVAAAGGGLTAIMAGAAIDWYWEIPAVRGLAFALLAAGLVPLVVRGARDPWMPEPRFSVPTALRLVPILIAAVAAAAQFVPDREHSALATSHLAADAGDLAKAGTAADRAIALRPESPAGYTQRGLIAEAAGRPAEAIVEFQLALHRTPGLGDWKLHTLLARAHAEAGEPAAAIKAMADGRRSRPNGRFFRRYVERPDDTGHPRACTGDFELELEHCERLPRVNGGWELPRDPATAGQRELPDNTIHVLLMEAVSADAHRRDAAIKLLRLLDARPAPPTAIVADAPLEDGDPILAASVSG